MPEFPTGSDGDAVTVRLPRRILRLLDAWRRERSKSRAQAIRSLIEQALATDPMQRPSRKSAAVAADLAGKAIDEQGDPTIGVVERARRKRRLVEGPMEFRPVRRDRRK